MIIEWLSLGWGISVSVIIFVAVYILRRESTRLDKELYKKKEKSASELKEDSKK